MELGRSETQLVYAMLSVGGQTKPALHARPPPRMKRTSSVSAFGMDLVADRNGCVNRLLDK